MQKILFAILLSIFTIQVNAMPSLGELMPIDDLKASDLEIMADYAQNKLEGKPEGAQVTWKNNQTKNKGRVRLVKKFQYKGMSCRTVEHRVYLEANADNFAYTSTICKNKDGKWVTLP